jgi:hypothetical protein
MHLLHTTTRRVGAVVAALVLALAGAIFVSGPAQAAGPTCTASSQATFSPGLQLLPTTQDIAFNAGYSNCVTPGHPEITSGVRSGTFTGPRGCLSILPPSASGTFVVTWNTGQTSTVTFTQTGQDVAGQTVLTATGTVTSGLFLGASFTEVLTQASLDLTACLIPPGVQSQSGVGTLVVL